MPIRRIKAQSPDPYLGKIQGDTELARLAHLNYVIDAINNGGGGGGGVLINGGGPYQNIYFSPSTFSSTGSTAIVNIDLPDPLPYKAYRAKIAMQSIDWPGYGYLYNWYAVDDARGLANPAGGTGLTAPNEWRVPDDADWDALTLFIGGTAEAYKIKSTLVSEGYPFYGWVNNSATATDNYNFSMLPGGVRDQTGVFASIGLTAFFWSQNAVSGIASRAYVNTNNVSSGVNFNGTTLNNSYGISVRLVREATPSELLLNDGDTSDTSSLDPYTGNDGKTYVTVKIGTQIWLAQNLRETKYNDNSDIFNASSLFGGVPSSSTWQAKGTAQEGAWTAYRVGGDTGSAVEYNPNIIRQFYNDVLENTLLDLPVPSVQPLWVASQDGTGPFYTLSPVARPWNKTHIKITPGYDVSDFPTINERSLLIQQAVEGNSSITFRPIKRSDTGALTIEDLNNYNEVQGINDSYVYVEILEYIPAYYGSGLSVALGASNLEDEEEIVALTYEINGVTYTEDLEAKKLSIQIAKIYEQLGIFDKYKV